MQRFGLGAELCSFEHNPQRFDINRSRNRVGALQAFSEHTGKSWRPGGGGNRKLTGNKVGVVKCRCSGDACCNQSSPGARDRTRR